jgi:hypothetical protein
MTTSDQVDTPKCQKDFGQTLCNSLSPEHGDEQDPMFTIWNLLQTKSRRAIQKTKKRWGWHYSYKPRQDLVNRLSQQTGISANEVRIHLQRLRNWLLKDEEWLPPRTK